MWDERLFIVVASCNGHKRPVSAFIDRDDTRRFIESQHRGELYRNLSPVLPDDSDWRKYKIKRDETMVPYTRRLAYQIIEVPFNPIAAEWPIDNVRGTYRWDDVPMIREPSR